MSSEIHTIRAWHIYLCPTCNASDPPKDKYVVTLCKQKDSIWGFFINSALPAFIRTSPVLLKAQIKISPEEYDFLKWDSYIGCNDLKTFFAWELKRRICALTDDTIQNILEIVEETETLDAEQKRVILASRTASE